MPIEWTPIADLPSKIDDLTDVELIPQARFWADQKVFLQESGAMQKFTEERVRRWLSEGLALS